MDDINMYRTFVAVLIRQFGEGDSVVLKREVYDALSDTLQLDFHPMDNGDIEVRLIEH